MWYLKCSQKILVSKPMWSLQNLLQLMLRVKPMLDLILIQHWFYPQHELQ